MSRTLSFGYVASVVTGILVAGMIVGITTHSSNAQTTQTTEPSNYYKETEHDREEILWLARVMYSETKRPHEQGLIAWVVRNRVEAGFTGSTYKEVALAKHQFSGLNSADPNYERNMALSYETEDEIWKTTIVIARAVYFADEELRPLPETVRHFYSPRSMSGGRTPSWAQGLKATHTITDDGARHARFAFYAGVR